MSFAGLPHQVQLAWATCDAHVELPLVEHQAVAGAVASRRREFTTTRALARAALARAGGPAVAVPVGADRAPVWPPGWVGSLTHCEGLRAAAVARAREVAAVGIDAEPLTVLGASVTAAVLDPEERRVAARLGPHGPVTAFSAKESLFKAWHPATRIWLDFDGARLADVRTDRAGRSGTMVLEIGAANLERWPGPRAVEAAWEWEGGRVHTSVAVAARTDSGPEPRPAESSRRGA
ncbi:4'-phosphopantetheinyl transferase superfamily protein [Glycomyces sp. L485]|uniref:4'-phosphopantetheinyl transferase family protein n=1 Tax=Glycomyces sp. L485 TaxID=2909235 RepID=UPI001F4A957C|nr:4'-phosphopantetheinyl transferase superfamily protein [Glycomyces sp. L485]MCH7231990.1 4'-phosphopantetheinyl transferase superfamily protein [Glycomyces sp. L485]